MYAWCIWSTNPHCDIFFLFLKDNIRWDFFGMKKLKPGTIFSWNDKNMTRLGAGRNPSSCHLVEFVFLFKVISLFPHVRKGWIVVGVGRRQLFQAKHHMQLLQRPPFPPCDWTGRIQDQFWLMGLKILSTKFLQNNVVFILPTFSPSSFLFLLSVGMFRIQDCMLINWRWHAFGIL